MSDGVLPALVRRPRPVVRVVLGDDVQALLDLRRGAHPLMELHQGLGPRLGVLPGVLAEGLHQLEVCPLFASLQMKKVIKESGKQIIHNSPLAC